ncbi:MAG: response regulator transcription factor, partial [Rubrobacteridae bacterium]|nr:response regulator transcription factor [Rubrobacteridae bacterium]
MEDVKVLVVEDHPLMQAGIKNALERCDDIRVVGEASSRQRAIELVDATAPDIVIMDIKLTDSDGITTMKDIKARCSSAKFLMFSGFDNEQYVVKAIESGATGYLLKNVGAKELVDAVRQIRNGMHPISPQLTNKLLPFMRNKVEIGDRLTAREKEVWQLLSDGA